MSNANDSRTPAPSAFTESATPAQPSFDALDYLPARERDVLLALRRVDFWRVGKSRDAVISWNGVRVRVGTVEQVGYG